MNIENLPKDVKREFALKMSPSELINLCITQKEFNKEICDSEKFWLRKLEKDYPEEFLDFYRYDKPIKNPKQIYIRRFGELSSRIEKFIDEFILDIFGSSSKYLKKDYRKDLYDIIYNIYSEALNIKDIDNLESSINDSIENYKIQLQDFIYEDFDEEFFHDKITDFILDSLFFDKSNMFKRKIAQRLKK